MSAIGRRIGNGGKHSDEESGLVGHASLGPHGSTARLVEEVGAEGTLLRQKKVFFFGLLFMAS